MFSACRRARPEDLDDVLDRAGAEHRPCRWTFPRWRIVAVAAAILVGGLLVTPALGIGTSLLDLLKGGPRGEPPHRVTAVGGPSFWSPDGKIVFAGRIGTPKNGQYQGYVMNPDGSGKRALLELGDGSFSWSPDGRMIAFRRQDGQVYVMNADGSGARRLTSRPGSWSVGAWSPDGRKLTLTASDRAKVGIYVMNADGSGQRRLTRASRASACLVTRRAEDRLLERQARQQRQQRGLRHERRREREPKADTAAGRRSQPGLVARRAEAHVPEPARRQLGGLRHEPRRERPAEPDAQPEERRLCDLVARRAKDRFRDPARRQLGGLRHEPRRQRKAEPDAQPGERRPSRLGCCLVPDGRKITFVSDRDGTYEVYVMNADGSGQRRLTHRGS